LKFIFLGTGTSQGVPVIGCDCEVCKSTDKRDNRLRSSILVQSEKTTIVVDTGPDFRYQMLRAKVKKLDAVLFTHAHKDHTAGLDDVRAYNFFQKKPMDIYATEAVQNSLRQEFYYAFEKNPIPGIPELNLHTITDVPFSIHEIFIRPVKVLHYKMPVLGYRFGDFTYITDANFIDNDELNKAKGSKVLVLNALRKQTHISHFTIDEAIAVAEKVGAEKTYFTHISHQLGLHAEIEKTLPEGMHLAYDGLEIDL
jgi:phosphoribosyl 1,2-cyclic phosphate phosphodiesterase